MTREEEIIAKLVALKSALPGQELDRMGLAIYARGLTDVPPDALDAALGRAVKECDWFPTVKKIRELAGIQGPLAMPQLAQAAWASVLGCLVSGQWTELDSPTRAALKALGGSWNVRQADERGLAQLKNRFLEAYRPAGEQKPALEAGEGPDKARVMRLVRDISKGGGR